MLVGISECSVYVIRSHWRAIKQKICDQDDLHDQRPSAITE